MALSIVSQPPALAPVRQPLRLVLQTNNYQLTAGTKARLRVNFAGSTNGMFTTLTINGKAYIFTARTTPDNNSAFEYAVNADTELALANLVDMLLANPFIADNYDITFSNFPFWFQLEAKQPGAEWTIQFAHSNGSLTQSANVAGVAPTYRPNFKVLLYLTAVGTTLQKDARANAANQCEFVLEEMLDNFLTVAPPDLQITGMSVVVPALDYALGYAESYGDNPLIQKRTTANYKALPGLFDKVNVPESSTAQYLAPTNPRKYWSTRPSTVQAKPHQVVLFANHNVLPFDRVGFQVRYRTNRSDGFLSAQVAVAVDGIFIVGEGLVCVYVSAQFISLEIGVNAAELYELEVALGYTQSAAAGPKYRTEYVTLALDQSEPTTEVALAFKAASGLFEVVYFEGDTDQTVNTTRSFADHLLPANYTRSQGEVREVEVTRQKRYVLHSGNRRRDYIVWLQGLVGSNEVYMLSAGLTQRTRVNIVAHSDDLSSTNQELFSMQVTIQEAFIDRA
ncbi:hypothetical protein [Microcystis phage Mae-Yong924-2]|nr:hypothetical protein [Microcystis phage Mea-Yong924-1]QYC50719.1 hypothetical protein [Microcystis phage Mae-Yong924-2]